MSNLFATAAMAEGYARSRPPIHPWVLAQLAGPFRRALDLGCGSGLSTAALKNVAAHRIGLEPALPMLAYAPTVAPGAHFLAGHAESLPFANEAFDLVTAAGSLNYCDLLPTLDEVRRVLTPEGQFAIYDFSPGREFPDSPALADWNTELRRRYPTPAGRREFTHFGEPFALALPYTAESYLDYVLTNSNISAAIASGTPVAEIRSWCASTLAPVFAGQTKQVLFRGYLAVWHRSAAWSPPAF
jgi:ubiquinone/menaquinone biosynthesis C-methylase UbiE